MDLQTYLISDDLSISEAVKRIDEGKKKVIFCTHDGRLTGCFTDGDLRRYLLRDGDMSKPVSAAMNPEPIAVPVVQQDVARSYVEKNAMVALPLVDEKYEVVSIIFRDDIESLSAQRRLPDNVPLVIVAGGKGTRLYPYTKILPKPLIPLGEKPIMDHIIDRFGKCGIRDVYMILNHKRNMIKAYYNETNTDYNIRYIDEEKFLGTGGGLSLLKGKIDSTFFLSNCDCLLDSDYMCMYEFHKQHENAITMILAMKSVTIPYGVVDLEADGEIRGFYEKPEYNYLVNTGIYLVEPFVIDMVKDDEPIGMPDIAKHVKQMGYKVGGYPVTEKSWLDMGQLNEMQNMMKELGL